MSTPTTRFDHRTDYTLFRLSTVGRSVWSTHEECMTRPETQCSLSTAPAYARSPSGHRCLAPLSTSVDELIDEGWDVWLLNWRAPRSTCSRPAGRLDDVAAYDHPAAVRYVLNLS